MDTSSWLQRDYQLRNSTRVLGTLTEHHNKETASTLLQTQIKVALQLHSTLQRGARMQHLSNIETSGDNYIMLDSDSACRVVLSEEGGTTQMEVFWSCHRNNWLQQVSRKTDFVRRR